MDLAQRLDVIAPRCRKDVLRNWRSLPAERRRLRQRHRRDVQRCFRLQTEGERRNRFRSQRRGKAPLSGIRLEKRNRKIFRRHRPRTRNRTPPPRSGRFVTREDAVGELCRTFRIFHRSDQRAGEVRGHAAGRDRRPSKRQRRPARRVIQDGRQDFGTRETLNPLCHVRTFSKKSGTFGHRVLLNARNAFRWLFGIRFEPSRCRDPVDASFVLGVEQDGRSAPDARYQTFDVFHFRNVSRHLTGKPFRRFRNRKRDYGTVIRETE